MDRIAGKKRRRLPADLWRTRLARLVKDFCRALVSHRSSRVEYLLSYFAMGRSRRNVSLDDDADWVFNRMADSYDARPPYPVALVDAILELAMSVGPRLLEIGAGIGHLALPLARRGLDVVAIEPARRMLLRLQSEASRLNLPLRSLHAAAEALPFGKSAFDCATIADAMHFLDTELVAAQLQRVLVPGGVLVIVTCSDSPTPFMHDLRKLVAQSADRRRRNVTQTIRQLASLAEVRLTQVGIFQDETPVDAGSLERILKSVSFIGPAMDGTRFDTLRERIQTIAHQPIWARTFTLYAGRHYSQTYLP